jgi:phosphoribosyl 1,2-cyclic phosphate phosphodiesterase
MRPCPPLKITFLGTGTSQGVPVIACDCAVCLSSNPKDQRLRSSILIESPETTLVIDAGPDFRQQMLRAGVQKLDAVLMTHEHKDHIAGLDDVRAFNFKQQVDMPVYCTTGVETALRREFHYAFSDKKYPGVPEITPVNIHAQQPFSIGDLWIEPIEVMHHKLPVLGFRIGGFTYITDAKTIEESELEKIKGSTHLVLNALRIKPHLSHFNLEEALMLMAHLKPAHGYFIHMSHLLGLHDDINPTLPASIQLAYDGLVLDLPAYP